MRMDEFRTEISRRSIKICLLLPPKECKFNIDNLKTELLNFRLNEDPVDMFESKPDLKIKKLDKLVSGTDDPLSLTTMIENVDDIESTNLIHVKGFFEEYSSFIFRDTRFLYPKTTIFELILIPVHKKTEIYVLILLKKEKGKKLIDKFRPYLTNLGLRIHEGVFLEDDIEEIRKQLDGHLKDTILKDFSSPKITQKRIYGDSFEDDESYLRDREEGKIYSHQMNIPSPENPEQRITVGISRDGFIRFYNNVTLETLVVVFYNLQGKLRFYRINTLDAYLYDKKESSIFEKIPS